jgi:PAS domain S-box-containing protein
MLFSSPDRPEASAELFAELLAGLPSGVVAYRLEEPGTARDLRVVYLNAAAARLLRVEDPSLLLGQLVGDIDPSVDTNPAYPVILEAIATGQGADLGHVAVQDGQVGRVVFAARVFPLPDRHAGVVFEEVTEQVLLEERLSHQQEELRTLAGATFEGVGLIQRGQFLLVNEALALLLGQPASELIGRPADLDVGLPDLPDALDEERHALEAEIRRPDGTTLPVELRTRRVRFAGEEARAVVVRDISERVRSLEALNRQALRFRAIFDATFQFIGLLRPDGTLVEANQTALEFGGIEPDDVIGKPLWETYWWGHSPRAQQRLRDAIARAARGELVRYNERVRGANDSRVVIDFTLKPVFDGEEVVLLIPEGRDISDLIRAQRALRRQQRRTIRILNAAGEGILGVDAEGVVTFANEAAAALLGGPPEALLGLPHAEVLRHTTADGSPPQELPIDRVLRRGRAQGGGEGFFEGPDGTRFPAEYVVTPLAEEGAQGAVIVFRDVSERREAEGALRDSEERYRALFAALHEGVVLQDRDGTIVAANPAAERILGLTMDQMAGRTSLDPRWGVITPDGDPLPGDQHPAMVALRTGEEVHGFVQGVRQPSGELRWILVNASLIWGPDPSSPDAVVATFYDVTEQREAEQALRRRELHHRTILNTLKEGVLLVGASGQVLSANASVRELFDLPEGVGFDLYQGDRWRFVREDGTFYPQENLPEQRVLRSGEAVFGEVKGVHTTDGELRWVSVNAQPVQGPDGTTSAVVMSFEDITERKAAELALRQREGQLRAAQQIAHVGDWHWEPNTGTIRWSDELYRIFGHEPGAFEPTFEQYVEQIHPDDRETVQAEISAALAERRAYEVIHRVVRPDGRDPARPRAGGGGARRGRGGRRVPGDGPGHHRAGAVPPGAPALRPRARGPQRRARAVRLRGEPRPPGAPAHGVELPPAPPAPLRRAPRRHRRRVHRLRRGRGEADASAHPGPPCLQPDRDAGEAVPAGGPLPPGRGRAHRPRPRHRRHRSNRGRGGPPFRGRRPHADAPAPPEPRRQRDQVPGPDPPLVRLRAVREGPAWRITVSDAGIGIAPEHRDRIFQIFQRLHTRDEYEGTGIGLAICKRIVERHGGRIWVDSAEEGGAAFHFTLPARLAPRDV